MRHEDSFTYRSLFGGGHLSSLLSALVLLAVSYIVEHFANLYAFTYSIRPTSTFVGDLFLDNIPAVNLNFIIIEIALLSIVGGTIFVFLHPRRVVFSLKAVALFIIIRAVFTSLTHVGIYPDYIEPSLGFFGGVYTYLNFQTGFFFSGHTGLPFLIALIFWDRPLARNVLLLLSLVFAVAVLLAHIHYSIDVFAAPFMTYGIFKIAQRLFQRDYALTRAPLSPLQASAPVDGA